MSANLFRALFLMPSWIWLAIWFIPAMLVYGGPLYRGLQLAAGGQLIEEGGSSAPSDVWALLSRLDPGQRTDYLWFQLLDLVPVLCMAGASGLLIWRLAIRLGGATTRWRWLGLLPLCTLGAELVENSLIASWIVAAKPPWPPAWVLQQVATTTKFISFGLVVLILLGLSAGALARWHRLRVAREPPR